MRYMTIGGAGSPMYAQPQAGGFAHYVLVSVGPAGVEYNVIEPGRLDVDYVAGNDGIEPLSIARVANGTDRDLALENLEFRVPRLRSPELYRVTVDYVDWERVRQHVPTRVREVSDLADGSVRLSIAVVVPTGVAFRVSVEARP